jgi:hypothetical protein
MKTFSFKKKKKTINKTKSNIYGIKPKYSKKIKKNKKDKQE